MKYMVTWSIPPENLHAVLERWKNENPQPGDGARIVERWHILGTGQGFTLMDVTDHAAMARYNMTWADLVELEMVPVMDEQEAIAAFS